MEKYLLLALLVAALALFASERFRADMVALGLLLALLLTGMVTVQEGFSGFASPAVITVVCMFILSGGLVRAGVADQIAHWVLARGLRGQVGLAAVLMTLCGLMSSFMNNIAAVTILLPSVFAIAQRSGVPVTKLLIPLSFGSLLGGLTTLVGTPPNLLASEALARAGHAPFKMFDFLPTGLAVFATGLAYFAIIGVRLVPVREAASNPDEGAALRHYVAETVIPAGSSLAGKRLDQSRIRDLLGLRVLRMHRGYRVERGESAADRPWLRLGRHGRDEGNGQYSFVPWPEAVLDAGDHLQVEGDPSHAPAEPGPRPARTGRSGAGCAGAPGQWRVADRRSGPVARLALARQHHRRRRLPRPLRRRRARPAPQRPAGGRTHQPAAPGDRRRAAGARHRRSAGRTRPQSRLPRREPSLRRRPRPLATLDRACDHGRDRAHRGQRPPAHFGRCAGRRAADGGQRLHAGARHVRPGRLAGDLHDRRADAAGHRDGRRATPAPRSRSPTDCSG
jgi:hypothetical protein